ncbi:hypothetical protein L209DRAFT_754027 [Thermothelomyces heterothallicus CBS 203.75]
MLRTDSGIARGEPESKDAPSSRRSSGDLQRPYHGSLADEGRDSTVVRAGQHYAATHGGDGSHHC